MLESLEFRRANGFTLIELLVVIGIILLLAAITIPVMSSAKASARHSVELNALRQIGAAGQLYSQQWDHFPTSARQLLPSHPQVKDLLVSPRDPYPDSLVQGLRRFSEGLDGKSYIPKDYRSSFVGFGDYLAFDAKEHYPDHHWNSAQAAIQATIELGKNGGWLVSYMPQAPETLEYMNNYWNGPVDRLTFEGSVIRRPNCRISYEHEGLRLLNLCLADLTRSEASSIWGK